MSLIQALADTVRDKGRSSVSITPSKPTAMTATGGSPAIKSMIPSQSSGGTGLGMAKKSGGMSMGASKGIGSKNGVGFPKKAGMASGGSGIKGPTKLGKDVKMGKGGMR